MTIENKEGRFSGISKLFQRKSKREKEDQAHLQKDLFKILQIPESLKKRELDISRPRAWPIEKQMEVIDIWVSNHPNNMPNLIHRMLEPYGSNSEAPRESTLDTVYLHRVLALWELFADERIYGGRGEPTIPDHKKYPRIVDLCVDDFLEGKVPTLGKGYIKLALRAVKQGKPDQTYYDKVMKAGMEVLLTN